MRKVYWYKNKAIPLQHVLNNDGKINWNMRKTGEKHYDISNCES